MKVEWHPFDYDNKDKTRPQHENAVWVVDAYDNDRVGVGYFDGYTMVDETMHDDCCITFWADIDYPDAPGKST